ncbi:MAG: hypothetical protein ACXWC3_31380, partial [Burkholderiales bacterium]
AELRVLQQIVDLAVEFHNDLHGREPREKERDAIEVESSHMRAKFFRSGGQISRASHVFTVA